MQHGEHENSKEVTLHDQETFRLCASIIHEVKSVIL